jgi:hypothetical protein
MLIFPFEEYINYAFKKRAIQTPATQPHPPKKTQQSNIKLKNINHEPFMHLDVKLKQLSLS